MQHKKLVLWLVIGILLATAVSLAPTPITAQGTNLLTNPGFENGHHHQDGIAEIVVPDGWRLNWVDDAPFSDSYNGLPAYRPETVVWDATGGIPAGEAGLWRDGIFTFKLFKSWAPMYAALSQDVSGLQVGRRYQLVAPVYTDIYDWEGRKVPPTDASHGQVRLGASPVGAAWRNEAAIAYSGWSYAAYGNYATYTFDFTVTQASMTVWIEVKGTYPHSNNGFFMDTLALYALDQTAPVNPGSGSGSGGGAAQVVPTATPLVPPTPRADGAIVHIVGANDTLWTIAIQYASVMGLTPEQALPRIQELNNNPAFIALGQELIIVPPTAVQPTPEPTLAATAVPTPTATLTTSITPTATVTATEASATVVASTAVPTTADQTAICVSVFNDDNGDGLHNIDSESLLADAAVTVSRTSTTVATYVSNGLQENYCFEGLEPDTYQVQFFPPADYQATTDSSWAVVVSAGSVSPVNFGAQYSPGATTSDVTATDTPAAAAETAVSTPSAAPTDTPAETESNNTIRNIVIGIAVFLVVVAAVGVVLLRRS